MANKEINVNRWNWGAFFLTWIWGLGNRTYIGFTMLIVFIAAAMLKVIIFNVVPVLNHPGVMSFLNWVTYLYVIFMHVIHGLRGSRWSWQHKEWASARAFTVAQRVWTVIGVVVCAAVMTLSVILFTFISNNKIFQQSLVIAKTSPQLQLQIGAPINVSLLSLRGGFHSEQKSGTAFYRFTAQGSANVAAVYVYAMKENGIWQIKEESAGIAVPGEKEIITLLYGQRGHIHFKV